MSVALSRDLAPGTSLKGSASRAGLLGALAETRARCYPDEQEQGRRNETSGGGDVASRRSERLRCSVCSSGLEVPLTQRRRVLGVWDKWAAS